MIVTLERLALHTKRGLCRDTCYTDCTQVLEDTLRAYVLDHKGRGLIALSEIHLQQ